MTAEFKGTGEDTIQASLDRMIANLRDQAFTKGDLSVDIGDPKYAIIEGRVNLKALARAVLDYK